MNYTLYRSRFLCRCAFMRLRRLCLAIFAFRLFLREPIQLICEARVNHLIRRIATQFRCEVIITGRILAASVQL